MTTFADDPNMSDTTIIVSVEDLIHRAMGPPGANVINFKLVQMILQILARQQRMLQQKVEIQITELTTAEAQKTSKIKSTEESTESSSKSHRLPSKPPMSEIKEEEMEQKLERGKQKGKVAHREMEKAKKIKEKQDDKEQEKGKDDKEQEKGKDDKEQEKGKGKKEKRAEKEKERAERERSRSKTRGDILKEKEEIKKDAVTSPSGLSIKETKRGKDNVIIVEKGPTTRMDSRSATNIEVVTRSQFALLEAAVNELKDIAVPKPLSMPDNEKLRKNLAEGTATLPDAMEAMQVGARVKAAEAAIERMSELLTRLAAADALPDDVEDHDEEAQEDDDEENQTAAAEIMKSRISVGPSRKSVLIDPKVSQASRPSARDFETGRHSRLEGPSSVSISTARSLQMTPKPSVMSRVSTISVGPGVTQEEMELALKSLRDEMTKSLQSTVNRAAGAAETALHTAMNVSSKLDIALKLDLRISSLYTIVGDYSEQLTGFDAGLTTQMQSFKDQISQLRSDLRGGLEQLDNVNNNAETAAVMELTERYTELVSELDATLSAHTALQQLQSQLDTELHSLVECVEMLREQKCDRDEVLDGLRDKADSSRLAGLLSETQFATARSDFERRLDLCHDKFRRQDSMWTSAITDLSRLTDQKAELIELLSLRDATQKQLQEVHERLQAMAQVLGEPKAALLTRQLARGAVCGACGASALMEPRDAYDGAPPRLPPLRPQPEPEPGERWITADPPQDRHVCHRWAGGSHTLLGAAPRERAVPLDIQTHTRKYTGHGIDGRLYMMEEDLKPCVECNLLSTDVKPEQPEDDGGAGDTNPITYIL